MSSKLTQIRLDQENIKEPTNKVVLITDPEVENVNVSEIFDDNNIKEIEEDQTCEERGDSEKEAVENVDIVGETFTAEETLEYNDDEGFSMNQTEDNLSSKVSVMNDVINYPFRMYLFKLFGKFGFDKIVY